jgi:hypothetical protein
MKKVTKCIVMLGMISGLYACSKHPELAYLNGRNGHKLVVKSPLTRHFIDDTFVLPNVQRDSKQPSTEPPKLG